MADFQIPAEARRALEELARVKREPIRSPREKRLARLREARERQRDEQALLVARRVMLWARELAATGALAGLGDVVILRDQVERTTTIVAVNGNGEVHLSAGSYMGGGSCRCTTAQELARNFVPLERVGTAIASGEARGGLDAYVRVSGERIEEAIASGEVWEHLVHAVTGKPRRKRLPPRTAK